MAVGIGPLSAALAALRRRARGALGARAPSAGSEEYRALPVELRAAFAYARIAGLQEGSGRALSEALTERAHLRRWVGETAEHAALVEAAPVPGAGALKVEKEIEMEAERAAWRKAFEFRPAYEAGTFNAAQQARCAALLPGWAAAYWAWRAALDGQRASTLPGDAERAGAVRRLESAKRAETAAWGQLLSALDGPLFDYGRGPLPFDGATETLLLRALRARGAAAAAIRSLGRAKNHRGWGRSRLDRAPYRMGRDDALRELEAAKRALAARVAPAARPPDEFEAMAEAALMGPA